MIEVTYHDEEITKFVGEKDGTYLGVPVYYLPWTLDPKERIALREYGYRKIYEDMCYARDYYTKGQINFISAKVMGFLNERVLWRFLKIMYRIGFIYIPEGEAFSWKRHFFVVARG